MEIPNYLYIINNKNCQKMKNQNEITSKREYEVLISDAGMTTKCSMNITRLLNPLPDDYEYLYAAYDVLDQILDLRVGESMYFQPIRDNASSKGIICRVN